MKNVNKKKKLSSAQDKVIKYQEQGNVAFKILVKSQMLPQRASINELITLSIIMLVAHCIGTSYGFMDKTNKLSPVHYLTTGVADTSLLSATVVKMFFIEDDNAHFHTLKNLL